MEGFTSIGLNIFLEALKDKGQRAKVRKPALKVFKTLIDVYGEDEAFLHTMREYVKEKDGE